MTVYLLKNKITGQGYVGRTTQPVAVRARAHRNAALNNGYGKRTCPLIQAAICEYGWDAFELSVLEECATIEDLDAKEVEWVEKLGTLAPLGYNLTTGGTRGFKHHPESVAKLVESNTGQHRTPEQRARQSDAAKSRWATPGAKNFTTERRQKMSETAKKNFTGRKQSEAQVAKRAEEIRSRFDRPEYKEKAVARLRDPEFIANAVEKRKATKFWERPGYREKCAEARREYYARKRAAQQEAGVVCS